MRLYFNWQRHWLLGGFAIAALIAVALFFFVHQNFLDQRFYTDELKVYFLPALKSFLGERMTFEEHFHELRGHPPLFHALIALLVKIFSFSIEALRGSMFLISCAIVGLGCSLAWRLGAGWLGALLAALLAFSNKEISFYLFSFAPELFSSLGFLLFLMALEKESRWLFYCSISFLALTRESSVFLIASLIFMFICSKVKFLNGFAPNGIKRLDMFIGALISLSWFLAHKYFLGQLLGSFASLEHNIKLDWAYWAETIKAVGEAYFVRTWFWMLLPFPLLMLWRNPRPALIAGTILVLSMFMGLPFYYVNLQRYYVPAMLVLCVIVGASARGARVLRSLLLILGLVVVGHNFVSVEQYILNRHDGYLKVNDEYKLLKHVSALLPEAHVVTDPLHPSMCEYQNLFEGKKFDCSRIIPLEESFEAENEEGFFLFLRDEKSQFAQTQSHVFEKYPSLQDVEFIRGGESKFSSFSLYQSIMPGQESDK